MPSVSPQTHRRLMALLQSVRSLSDQEDMEMQAMSRAAHDLMDRLAPRRAPKKTLPGPSRAKERAARKVKRREKTAQIRAEVFKRADDACEWCAGTAVHLHHLEGGTGRRVRLQSVSNTVALCFSCHTLYHRNPDSFTGVVRVWAARHGYPVPRRHQ